LTNCLITSTQQTNKTYVQLYWVSTEGKWSNLNKCSLKYDALLRDQNMFVFYFDNITNLKSRQILCRKHQNCCCDSRRLLLFMIKMGSICLLTHHHYRCSYVFNSRYCKISFIIRFFHSMSLIKTWSLYSLIVWNVMNPLDSCGVKH